MQTNPADEQSNIHFWPRNVVKRVILLSECLSVRPSVTVVLMIHA